MNIGFTKRVERISEKGYKTRDKQPKTQKNNSVFRRDPDETLFSPQNITTGAAQKLPHTSLTQTGVVREKIQRSEAPYKFSDTKKKKKRLTRRRNMLSSAVCFLRLLSSGTRPENRPAPPPLTEHPLHMTRRETSAVRGWFSGKTSDCAPKTERVFCVRSDFALVIYGAFRTRRPVSDFVNDSFQTIIL